MIGIFLFLAIGIMGAAGVFFVLNKGKAATDVYANMGLTATPSSVDLEIEIEKNTDPGSSSPFYIADTGRQSKTFNVRVSGLTKTASTQIHANSMSPEIVFAEVVGLPDEKGNSTVRVTAKNGGTAQVKITTFSGARTVYVTVNVKLEAKGIALNQGVHNGVVKKNDATAVLTFDESKFTFYAHPEDTERIYKTNSHTVAYTWSPLNTAAYDSVRVVGNTLEVDANAPQETEVWVRAAIEKTGEIADFPVYIFRPFTNVNAKKTFDVQNNRTPTTEYDEPADPNDDGRYAEYGTFNALDLIHNRTDQNEEKILANYQFSMPGWNDINKYYGIMARSENSQIITVEMIPTSTGLDMGNYRFDVNNVLGKTRLNVIAYPIATVSILRGGIFIREVTNFNLGDDTVVQKKVSMTAYNRNEFRREDEPLEDGKMYFERDGKRLNYENYDKNKNGAKDNGEVWVDIDSDPTTGDENGLEYDNGEVLYAFAYPSNTVVGFPEKYYTEFRIGSVDIPINAIDDFASNDVVFELVFAKGRVQNTFSGSGLNTYLSIRADGVPISQLGNHAPYTSTFSIALTVTAAASAGWVSPDVSLWLRVKSYRPLTNGYYSNLGDANGNGVVNDEYAIAEIGLNATNAIDDLFIKRLPETGADMKRDYNAAQTTDIDIIPLIIPDNGTQEYADNITPEYIVYGSSFVQYGGNPNTDWELDATKVKIETFGAPIKPLNGGMQAKVSNKTDGYYSNDGVKYISGTYINYDANENGIEDNGQNGTYNDGETWSRRHEWTGGIGSSSGNAGYYAPNNVIYSEILPNAFIPGENRRTNLVRYVFAVDVTMAPEKYKEYPIRFTYPNGVYKEVKVIIYPYVKDLGMDVRSSGGGHVYEKYKIDGIDISKIGIDDTTSLKRIDKPKKETQKYGYWEQDGGSFVSVTREEDLYTSAAYVRVGANYELFLNTGDADVGAKAVFTEMTWDGNSYPDGNNKSVFQALREGVYEARVTLTAANDDVFRRFNWGIGADDSSDGGPDGDNGEPGFQKKSTSALIKDTWWSTGFRRSWYIKIIVINPIISADFTSNDLQLTAARTLGVGEIGKAQQEMGVRMMFAYPVDEQYHNTMGHVILGVGAEDAVEIIGLNEALNKIIDSKNQNMAESRFMVVGQYETDTTAKFSFSLRQEFTVPGSGLPVFTLNYSKTMELRVDIIYGNPVEDIVLVDGPYTSGAVSSDGRYIGIYYTPGMPVVDVAIGTEIFPEYADNSQIGFAFAEWKNSAWDLSYSPDGKGGYVVGYSILNDGGAVNKKDGSRIVEIVDDRNKVAVLQARGYNHDVVFDTQIGLVAYALDSMRRVDGTPNDPDDNVFYNKPLTYSVVPVFVASVDKSFGDLAAAFFSMVHDANSGVKNNLGGYNWTIKAEGDAGVDHAALFLTARPRAGTPKVQSVITANRYYIDDLYTVLGWPMLNTDNKTLYPQFVWSNFMVIKINPSDSEKAVIGDAFSTNGRPFLELRNNTGSFILIYDYNLNRKMDEGETVGYFTVVPGLSTISISTGGKGKLARQTLDSLLKDTNYEYNRGFTARAGSPFLLDPEFPQDSMWTATAYAYSYEIFGATKIYNQTPKLYPIDEVINTTNYPMDDSRDFFVIPEITVNGLKYSVPELTSTIPVNLITGAKYLEIAQNKNTIDGHTAAIYDVTLITDKAKWEIGSLSYKFEYVEVGSYITTPVTTTVVLFGSRDVELGSGRTKVPLKRNSMNTGAWLVFTLTEVNTIKIDPETDPEKLIFYQHRVRIEISIVVDGTAQDPIFPLTGTLTVKENVPIRESRFHEAVWDEAEFNVISESVYNVQFEHFANVTTVDITKIKMDESQTGSREIYVDSSGGLLKVFTTPYYVSVNTFNIGSNTFKNAILTGYDKDKKPIYKYEDWSIQFIQYVYDPATKTYMRYAAPDSDEKGVQTLSTYLGGNEYGWDGVYYFKTVVQQDFQGKASSLPPAGTKFTVTAEITSGGKIATQSTILTVAYPPILEVNGPNYPDPLGIATIVVDAYQAIGTTKQYQIILPDDTTPFYEDMQVINGDYCYYTFEGQTLTVVLYATEDAIGYPIGFRVPYIQNDGTGFADQYYLLRITPVYFELTKMFYIQNHPEDPLLVDTETETEIYLRLEYLRTDEESLRRKIDNAIVAFEKAMNASILVSWWGVDGEGQYYSLLGGATYAELCFAFINDYGYKYISLRAPITVKEQEKEQKGKPYLDYIESYLRAIVTYSYVDGLPVIERNGRFMLESNQWVMEREKWHQSKMVWAVFDTNGDMYEFVNGVQVGVGKAGDYQDWGDVGTTKELSLKENMAIGTENSFRVDMGAGNVIMQFDSSTAYWYKNILNPDYNEESIEAGSHDLLAMAKTTMPQNPSNGVLNIRNVIPQTYPSKYSESQITYDSSSGKVKVVLGIDSPLDEILRVEIPYTAAEWVNGYKVEVPRIFKLDIVPVFFTFDGYRLLNSPDDPKKLTLDRPIQVILQADNIVRAPLDVAEASLITGRSMTMDEAINKAIDDFNISLLDVANNSKYIEYFAYTGLLRIPLQDDTPSNLLNYRFYTTDGKAYIEKNKDEDSNSYFGVTTRIEYKIEKDSYSNIAIASFPVLTYIHIIKNGDNVYNPTPNQNDNWVDSNGKIITTVTHSWRVETTASVLRPPSFPEPGYTVQFGMETSIDVDMDGVFDTKLLVLADSTDWGKYNHGAAGTATQTVAWGSLSIPPDTDPTLDGHEFTGWIPSYWLYTYEGANGVRQQFKTIQFDQGRLIRMEVLPIVPMLSSQALSSDYLRDAYQITQDTIFMATFRDIRTYPEWPTFPNPPYPTEPPTWWPEEWPWPPEDGYPPEGWYPPDPDDSDPWKDSPWAKYPQEALSVWKVSFYVDNENGREPVQDTQLVVNNYYAIPPDIAKVNSMKPMGAGAFKGWVEYRYNDPAQLEVGILDVGERRVTRSIEYLADFVGMDLPLPGPTHTIQFMTFDQVTGQLTPFVNAQGKSYKLSVANAGLDEHGKLLPTKFNTMVAETPVYKNLTFKGWKVQSMANGSHKALTDQLDVRDEKGELIVDGLSVVLQFIKKGNVYFLGYEDDKGEHLLSIYVANSYQSLDLQLVALFEYEPVAAAGRNEFIALGMSMEFGLSGQDPRMDELYVLYDGKTIDGTSEPKGSSYLIFRDGKKELITLDWHESGALYVSMAMNEDALGKEIEIRIPFSAEVGGIHKDNLYYYIKLTPVYFLVDEIIATKPTTGMEYSIPDKANVVSFWDGEHVRLDIKTTSYEDSVDRGIIDPDRVNKALVTKIQLERERFQAYLDSIDGVKIGLLSILPVEPASNGTDGIALSYDDTRQINLISRTTEESVRATLQITGNLKYDDTERSIVLAPRDSNDDTIVVLSAKTYIMVTADGTSEGGNSPENPILIWKNNADDLKNMEAGKHYALMEDIDLLEDTKIDMSLGWQPIAFGAAGKYTSLDGNNFKIIVHENTFKTLDSTAENIGIFSLVDTDTVIRNLQIVIYDSNKRMGGGIGNDSYTDEVRFDLSDFTEEVKNGVKLGLLAGTNKGVITNCAILSGGQFITGADGTIVTNRNGSVDRGIVQYEVDVKTALREPDANYDISAFNTNTGKARGRIVVDGVNNIKLDLYVGGLVGSNEGSITNSRVLVDVELCAPKPIPNPTIADSEIINPNLKTAVVGGVVGKNSKLITATFFSDANVINEALVINGGTGVLGGFVGQNLSGGNIMASYIMGISTGRTAGNKYIQQGAVIWSDRNSIGAFVYQNAGTISDCFTNVVLKKMGPGEMAGFVHTNSGTVQNCIVNNSFVRATDDVTSQAQFFEFVKTNYSATSIQNCKYLRNSDTPYPGDAPGDYVSLEPEVFVNGGLGKTLSIYNVKESVYRGFSMDGTINNKIAGQGIGASFNEINTIWRLTPTGPIPNSARYEIVYSMRRAETYNKTRQEADLIAVGGYKPKGQRENPELIYSENEYTGYLSSKKAMVGDGVTQSSVRLINDITFTAAPSTYNIIYQDASFDGNGFTLLNVFNLRTGGDAKISSTGVFAKIDNAKFKNLNIVVHKLSGTGGAMDVQSYNYVGGLAGIAIDTDLIDIDVKSASSSDTIIGGHIVGGLVGVLTATEGTEIRVFNVTASTAVWSKWRFGSWVTGEPSFGTGKEYYQGQQNNKRENGSTIGLQDKQFYKRAYYSKKDDQEAQGMGIAGNLFGVVTGAPRYSELEWDLFSHINDTTVHQQKIIIQSVGGSALSVQGDISGGLIGVVDENVQVDSASLTGLGTMTGKYYLGGIVGINLGTIENSKVEIKNFVVRTDAFGQGKYVYQDLPTDRVTNKQPTTFWGIIVGGVAGYNNGTLRGITSTAVMTDKSMANIYVVGGIVGQNDMDGSAPAALRGVVENCTTTNLITAGAVGFYFGNQVGQSADPTGNARVWESPADVSVTSPHFYEATISTPSILYPETTVYPLLYNAAARHFGGKITHSETDATPGPLPVEGKDGLSYTSNIMKIQTYTLQEYLNYIDENHTSWSIADLADKLEPIVRGLPRGRIASPSKEYSKAQPVYQFITTSSNSNTAVPLIDEDFDMAQFKIWLKINNIFNDTKTNNSMGYEAYLHYLDDNKYFHNTTGITTDYFGSPRVTGYDIGADYGEGAITLDEFKHYAVVASGARGNLINDLNFTIEDYINYLKYKLAFGIDYDGKNSNGAKAGVSLAEYKNWDAAQKGGFFDDRYVNNNRDIAWYWPISEQSYYYRGWARVNGVWQMVTSTSMDTTIAFGGTSITLPASSAKEHIKGTGFIGGNLKKRIVDNKGEEISGQVRAGGGHVWDYYTFLNMRTVSGSHESYFAEVVGNTENGIQLYARWLYDSWGMTLEEYIEYLKNGGLTQEETAYLLAFGDTQSTLQDLHLTMAQYKMLTEYESVALGYKLSWYFTGADAEGKNQEMDPRGVGTNATEIADYYKVAELTRNTVYLKFDAIVTNQSSPNYDPNYGPKFEASVLGYVWTEDISTKKWSFKKGSVEYKFSAIYNNTYTISPTNEIVVNGTTTPATPGTKISFEEYLQIYSTAGGLKDHTEGGTKAGILYKDMPKYTDYIAGTGDYAASSGGKNMITANEDYLQLVKLGEYAGTTKASLYDYHSNFPDDSVNIGKNSSLVSVHGIDSFARYLFGIKTSIYGWSKEAARFIYNNMDKDEKWGVVGTYYSVYQDTLNSSAGETVYHSVLAKSSSFTDNTTGANGRTGDPSGGTFTGLNNGRRNDIRYATLFLIGGNDNFTPNALKVITPSTGRPSGSDINENYVYSTTAQTNILEWAYYWKKEGFSAMQFETMKNKVVFSHTRVDPITDNIVWTWDLLKNDYKSFLSQKSDFQPYEYVDYILETGGSWDEYRQFSLGIGGANGSKPSLDPQNQPAYAKPHHYESGTDFYTVKNSTLSIDYLNPLQGLHSIPVYILMRRNGGSVAEYRVSHAGTQSQSTVENRSQTWGGITSAMLGGALQRNDKFELEDLFIGNSGSSSISETKHIAVTSGVGQWYAFVPAQTVAYKIECTDLLQSGRQAHPAYALYRVNGNSSITFVSSGYMHENKLTHTFTTPTLTLNEKYLIRLSSCIFYTQTPAYDFKLSVSSGKALYSDHEYINSTTYSSYSGTFPGITFYVDYIQRKKGHAGNSGFLTTTGYLNTLNRANVEVRFDRIWDDDISSTDKKKKIEAFLSGVDYSPQNVNLVAELGLTPCVDAMVNWALFNGFNPAQGYKFITSTGRTVTTSISYYDYIDWLLNYDKNTELAEVRQTWLTFEAFCVWKRMGVWDKNARGPYGNGSLGSSASNMWNVYTTEARNLFGLGLSPLSGMDKRGIYFYYSGYWGQTNLFNRGGAEGSPIHGIRWAKNMDTEVSGGVYADYSYNRFFPEHSDRPNGSRVVPVGPAGTGAYEYLHIEYESHGNSYYYNREVISEKEYGGNDWYFITYVNPSFSQFQTAAESKYYELCTGTGSGKDMVVESTAGYDKYMYYWARNNAALGLIKVRPEGGYSYTEVSNSPIGSEGFWKFTYGEVNYQENNILKYQENCARKYNPINNRAELPEDENAAVASETEITIVQHW
jgi:hypothetical protein